MLASYHALLKKIADSNGPGIDTALTTGDNVVTMPTNADVVLIEPAPTNTATITVKGQNTDLGVDIHAKVPTIFATEEVSFLLTVSADTKVRLHYFQAR
jgi:hypothetical protein